MLMARRGTNIKLTAIGTSINSYCSLEIERSIGTQSFGNYTQLALLLTAILAARASVGALSTIVASTRTNLSSATTKMTAFIAAVIQKQLVSPYKTK